MSGSFAKICCAICILALATDSKFCALASDGSPFDQASVILGVHVEGSG